MIRKIPFLILSVIGNALGTALMINSNVGLTAWGSAAFNFGAFLNVSFGTAFIILALLFFVVAILLSGKIVVMDMIMSIAFLLSFGLLSDLFVLWIPSFLEWPFWLRMLINFLGLSILLLAIAIHLKVLIAVHPCDVFLYQMQVKLKSDFYGTYLTYGIALTIGIVFGVLTGRIEGIGLGTLMTVVLSGALIRMFNRTVLKNLTFPSAIPSEKRL